MIIFGERRDGPAAAAFSCRPPFAMAARTGAGAVRIEGIIWLDSIVEKLARKHRVSIDEVEEVFSGAPRFRYVERGHRRGEDVYAAIGKTRAGRSLIVFFVHKSQTKEALVVSARMPSRRERNL